MIFLLLVLLSQETVDASLKLTKGTEFSVFGSLNEEVPLLKAVD